jgi:hypothetical protein
MGYIVVPRVLKMLLTALFMNMHHRPNHIQPITLHTTCLVGSNTKEHSNNLMSNLGLAMMQSFVISGIDSRW